MQASLPAMRAQNMDAIPINDGVDAAPIELDTNIIEQSDSIATGIVHLTSTETVEGDRNELSGDTEMPLYVFI